MSVCVYCGLSFGFDLVYEVVVICFGYFIVDVGLWFVYGGGLVGFMGMVVCVVMDVGGVVIGVILKFL